MTIDVDRYLGRRFDIARCNCWHVVRDAWADLTGLDIGDRTPARITTAALQQRFVSDVPADFRRIGEAADPCLVLMRSPGEVPHVGVFTRGRILQMQPGGVSFLPISRATIGFAEVEFYRPCSD